MLASFVSAFLFSILGTMIIAKLAPPSVRPVDPSFLMFGLGVVGYFLFWKISRYGRGG